MNRYFLLCVCLLALSSAACGPAMTTAEAEAATAAGDDDMNRMDESAYMGVGDRDTYRRKDGWQVSGSLVTGMGANAKSVQLQADFGVSDVWTVQFNRDVFTLPENGSVVLCEALVQWSVEGNTVTRRISVADGATISGVSQAVRVTLYDVSLNVLGTPISHQTYSVAAQVARGTRGTNMQPPILIPTDLGTPDVSGNGAGQYRVPPGSVSIPVPIDAGVISLFATVVDTDVSSPVLGAFRIQQFATPGFILKQYDPRQFPTWVPMAPGATSITMINSSTDFDVTFSLAFGIDG